jgi:hypothetical protein
MKAKPPKVLGQKDTHVRVVVDDQKPLARVFTT